MMGWRGLLQSQFSVFMMSLTFSGVLSYSSWQNQVKDLYQLSQTQVEIIGTVLWMTTCLVLIGGFVIERWGIRVAGIASLLMGIPFIGIFTSLFYPRGLNGELYPLLVACWVVVGIGISINYINSLSNCLELYPKYAGRTFIVMAIGAASTNIFMSSGLLKLKGLIIYYSIVHWLSSLCCLFLLKEPPKIKVNGNSEAMKDNENNKNTGSDKDNKNSQKTSAISDSEVSETLKLKESEKLISYDAASTADSKSEGVTHGKNNFQCCLQFAQEYEAFTQLDFWLLAITVITISNSDVIVLNVGTFLRSFDKASHLYTLTTVAPILLLVSKIVVGVMVDFYKESIPGILILTVLLSIKFTSLIFFIFYADNIGYLYFVVLVSWISIGCYIILSPTIVAEYFGFKHFRIYYGSIFLVMSCYVLFLQFLIGVIYDARVDDVTTHTCHGLPCFYTSLSIICASTGIALVTSVCLYFRRRNIASLS